MKIRTLPCLAAISMLLLTGCEDDSDYNTDPQVTTLSVQLSQTARPRAVEIFVDDRCIGTVGPGEAESCTVGVGTHVVYARTTNGSYIWPASTVSVPANGLRYFLY